MTMRRIYGSVVLLLALAGCAGDADGDGFSGADDCDDHDPTAHIGGVEVCDGADNDCNGTVDDNASDSELFYMDGDDDGFGDGAFSEEACTASEGYVENASDCDDSSDEVNPDAVEVCNDRDDNCDDVIDEDCA